MSNLYVKLNVHSSNAKQVGYSAKSGGRTDGRTVGIRQNLAAQG